jgi:hypothetical protein
MEMLLYGFGKNHPSQVIMVILLCLQKCNSFLQLGWFALISCLPDSVSALLKFLVQLPISVIMKVQLAGLLALIVNSMGIGFPALEDSASIA